MTKKWQELMGVEFNFQLLASNNNRGSNYFIVDQYVDKNVVMLFLKQRGGSFAYSFPTSY
jgi:hypothetical protein